MIQKFGTTKERADTVVREIRRAARRRFSADEKIRIVLEGLLQTSPLPTRASMTFVSACSCRLATTRPIIRPAGR